MADPSDDLDVEADLERLIAAAQRSPTAFYTVVRAIVGGDVGCGSCGVPATHVEEHRPSTMGVSTNPCARHMDEEGPDETGEARQGTQDEEELVA